MSAFDKFKAAMDANEGKHPWHSGGYHKTESGIIASPIEYQWLLNGDPQPFIKYVKQNPDVLQFNWVLDVFFDALLTAKQPGKKKSRPKAKRTVDKHREGIKQFLLALYQGKTREAAIDIAADKISVSSDTFDKDIYRPWKMHPTGLFRMELELIKDGLLTEEQIENPPYEIATK